MARYTQFVVVGVAALLGLVLLGAALSWWLWKPAAPAANVCQRCGAEWYPVFPDRDRGPREPIMRCPECPMSEAEFEALKAAVRERKAERQEGEQ
jgi:hypothetical protein